MSLSKSDIKLITSLQQKKYRQKHELFVVEGVKGVQEFLQSSYELEQLFVVEEFALDFSIAEKAITKISTTDLKKISQLKTPNKVLGIFKIPSQKTPQNKGLIVALDDINDPGNLGTIIRLCDWFGVTQLICSKQTVDCYNSKVVQASMGSLTRVQINYLDLHSFLTETSLPTYTADMDGVNVYTSELPKEGVLIMGNEANGVSSATLEAAKHKVAIPRFGESQKTESLNVATATAILLSEFRR